MQRLADRYTLMAPDLRGFGDSDKPARPFGPDGHSADMFGLLDALGLARVGVVGHDVGGPVMQFMAQAHRSARGHFPHREDPERAAQEIDTFFSRLGWR